MRRKGTIYLRIKSILEKFRKNLKEEEVKYKGSV